MRHLRNRKSKLPKYVTTGAVGLGLVVSSLTGTAGATVRHSDAQAPVQLTFWSWVPGIQKDVSVFNASHPSIHVNYVDTSGAGGEFPKLSAALAAGKGAPDVVQISDNAVPSFAITKDLVNLNNYGIQKLRSQFYPSAWSVASFDGGVYGVPQDYGPEMMFYRADIFKKLGLTPPTTWAQFAADAVKIHAANPKQYITFIDPSDADTAEYLLWQAGADSFKTDGASLSIDLTNAAAQKYASFWTSLVNKKLVATASAYTTPFYSALASGEYATWLVGAWAPTFIESVIPKTAGDWAVAQLPQWGTGQFRTVQDASVDAVTVQSANKPAAVEFAEWLNSSPTSVKSLNVNSQLLPADTLLAKTPSWANATDSFLGGQQFNKAFIYASEHVTTDWQWPPVQLYAASVYADTVGQQIAKGGSILTGFRAWQAKLSSYAKAQGFTVTTG